MVSDRRDVSTSQAQQSRCRGMALSAFAIVLFCAVGPSLIFLNKHILTTLEFKYPMSVSGLGIVASAVLSRVLVWMGMIKLQHADTVDWSFWLRKVLPVGFAMTATLYFGNAAYIYLSVAFLQMMKAFAPVVTMCMMFAFKLEQPTCMLVSAILIIAVGTAVSGYGELHFSVLGVALLLMSEVCEAVKLVIQQLVLDNMRFPVVEGLYFMAPAASIFIVLGVGVMEWPEMVEKHGLQIVAENPLTFGMAGLLGFGVNFSGFLCIKLLGGLSMKVISTFRNIAVVVVSASFFGDVVTWVETVGYGISTVGILLFNFAKLYPKASFLDDLMAEVELLWGFSFKVKRPEGPALRPEAIALLTESKQQPAA